MSDRDSLYSVSISPPPTCYLEPSAMSQPIGKLQNPKKKATAGLSSSELPGSGAPRDWTAQSKSLFEQHMSYGEAPGAQMIETPTKNPSAAYTTPTSMGQEHSRDAAEAERTPTRRRRHGKEAVDYQADADLVDKRLDRGDPDYVPSQDVAGPSHSSSHKKRKASEPEAEPTRLTKKKKPAEEHNMRYERCDDESKAHRDDCILRIYTNWDVDSNRWIPENMIPRAKRTTNGKTTRIQLEPKDWNNPLLAELADLSAVTTGQPRIASKAIAKAVSRQNRAGGGPRLLASDVRHAMRMCKAVSYAPVWDDTPESASEIEEQPKQEENVDHAFEPEKVADEPIARVSLDSHESRDTQLPSPRSPNFIGHLELEPELAPELHAEPIAAATPVLQQSDEMADTWEEERAKLREQELKIEHEAKLLELQIIRQQLSRHEQARLRRAI